MPTTSNACRLLPVESATAAPVPPRSRRPTALLVLYGLTGFGGVLAEQGFERYVSLLVGATASGSAVVLFTYFLGFALGGVGAAHLLRKGRIARPLLAYGLVELAVGISCVAFSYWFHGLIAWMAPFQNLFGSAAMKLQVRFASGCLLVLPTAVLMGASFPLIATALDGWDSGRKRWSQAYSVNLAGAFLAAVAAPFVIMPVAGLRGALWLCFGIGLCVFVAAVLMPQPAAVLDVRDGRKPFGREIHVLLAASFASGAVFFALEVIWTHLIAVVIGCSVYAFAWMLAAVLLGLMLGGFLVNRSAGKGQAVSPALLFQCSALLLLFQLTLWNWAPAFFGPPPPSRFQNSFYYAEIFKLYVTFILLVPASTLLGLIYPTLLASPQLKREGNSYLAGYISAANSLGCLTGAWLGIFILVQRLGSEFSLKCVIAVLAAFWLAFLAREPRSRARLASAAVTVLLIAGGLAFYRWDWTRLTAGLGNYFGAAPVLAKAPDDGVQMSPVAMIFRHEDSQGGVTTVLQQTITARQSSRTIRTMMTNGKFQGDDNPDGQVSAQFGFAAIPSLFTRQLGRALLIGLGTGHSATTLRRVGYREIDIAEFSTGIVQAARQCFVSLNQGILSDPRVMLHIEDGRNVLLTDRHRQYDLITIEITSVWFAGSTNLYSQEFYELARQRLNPGGVLQQWVQLHHTSITVLLKNNLM